MPGRCVRLAMTKGIKEQASSYKLQHEVGTVLTDSVHSFVLQGLFFAGCASYGRPAGVTPLRFVTVKKYIFSLWEAMLASRIPSVNRGYGLHCVAQTFVALQLEACSLEPF